MLECSCVGYSYFWESYCSFFSKVSGQRHYQRPLPTVLQCQQWGVRKVCTSMHSSGCAGWWEGWGWVPFLSHMHTVPVLASCARAPTSWHKIVFSFQLFSTKGSSKFPSPNTSWPDLGHNSSIFSRLYAYASFCERRSLSYFCYDCFSNAHPILSISHGGTVLPLKEPKWATTNWDR